MRSSLPVHSTKRHPHTGEPLRAIWVRPDGRIMWPIIGAAPDDGADAGTGGAGDGTGGEDGADGAGGGTSNATDDQGRDLGYPKDTPVAEMTDAQEKSYWRHLAKKHEGRVKHLTGGRTVDETRAELEAYAKLQKEQQTPAEQQLSERYEQGKRDALSTSSTKAATAILRANLGAKGIDDGDVTSIIDDLDLSKFVTDDGDVDLDRLAATANRYAPKSDTDDPPKKRRDLGGGTRRGGSSTRTGGSVAQVMADRAAAREGKTTN